jgi:hypothetical protein
VTTLAALGRSLRRTHTWMLIVGLGLMSICISLGGRKATEETLPIMFAECTM